MSQHSAQAEWKTYLTQELSALAPLFSKYDIILSPEQPHIKGERFLMQALTTTGGKKLILVGSYGKNKTPAIIKATRDEAGAKELKHERLCREQLNSFSFAYDTFLSPTELLFTEAEGFTISVQTLIPQESTFLSRSTESQFDLALRALKAQELVHATTHHHFSTIKNTFGYKSADDYLELFKFFIKTATHLDNEDQPTADILSRTYEKLSTQKQDIERYCGFLTHTDFVPHNFRIHDNKMYLLDFSSLRFGNKHEGWARFLNFMTLYNHDLETALLQYVSDNRAPEEQVSLQLMRLYRLGEIITYYINTLAQSEGDLHTLNSARVTFWSNVLKYEYAGERVPREIVSSYKKLRDALRSTEEKERQINLH